MKKIKWYINRLLKMNLFEIFWRIKYKINSIIYFKKVKKGIRIDSFIINNNLKKLNINIKKLYLNNLNNKYSITNDIKLLGKYKYKNYKTKWNIDFFNNKPYENICSFKLDYKNSSIYGDARLNWELNRHYQFIILSKNYFITREKKYLDELLYLYNNYNNSSNFLYGITWVSTMEIAIRCNSWIYMYYFLKQSDVSKDLLDSLEIAIINMTDYIYNFPSKYSSANNHLIIEAFIIGQSGILFNYEPWINFAINTFNKELLRQNYNDGINKEMSLHYHTFFMEALLLFIRLLNKNGYKINKKWNIILDKMSKYLNNCIDNYNNIVEFGDNDEGKILDLNGNIDYYKYILELSSLVLNNKYVNYNQFEENIYWLFNDRDFSNLKTKTFISKCNNICYKEGGITLLKSLDKNIFIGIDHGDLGFDKLSAHAHADMLSFQLFYKDIPILVDLGTYLYFSNMNDRNYFRSTINHNTASINNLDQSLILGPFMWNKKYKYKLKEYVSNKDKIILEAVVYNHKNNMHNRKIIFNKNNRLIIKDSFNNNLNKVINYNFGPKIKIIIKENFIYFYNNKIKGYIYIKSNNCKINIEKKKYSQKYGEYDIIKAVNISTNDTFVQSDIYIEEVHND